MSEIPKIAENSKIHLQQIISALFLLLILSGCAPQQAEAYVLLAYDANNNHQLDEDDPAVVNAFVSSGYKFQLFDRTLYIMYMQQTDEAGSAILPLPPDSQIDIDASLVELGGKSRHCPKYTIRPSNINDSSVNLVLIPQGACRDTRENHSGIPRETFAQETKKLSFTNFDYQVQARAARTPRPR